MSDGADIVEWLRRVFERGGVETTLPALGLLGSSRKDGATAALTHDLFARIDGARLVDLGALSIAPYDYDHANEGDDFLPLAFLLTQAHSIVFATPVYWYSMSAQMKTVFDRLTDLTETHEGLGRALAGKPAFAVATSNSAHPPASFEPPLADTARYFGMRWGGLLHEAYSETEAPSAEGKIRIAAFADKIKTAIADDEALGAIAKNVAAAAPILQ